MRGAPAWLWARLSSPRAGWFVVCAGLLLTAGSLTNGVVIDDRYQRAVLLGSGPVSRAPWDLYRVFSGDAAELTRLADLGFVPWWTSPEVKTAFFRPLSSLSVALDYLVLPHWPWLFHLESLALFGLLVALVHRLYRGELADPRLAALAGLLFAVEEGHGIAVGWLANRNALFAAVCGLGAVLLARRGGAGRAWSALCLALGLAFGEVALGAFAYVLAWALTREPGPLWRRLLTLAPHAAVLLAWVLATRGLDFGVRGNDFYVDPAESPLRFLRTFPGWLLTLASSQFLGAPSADLWFVWAGLPWPALAAVALTAVAALGLLGRALAPRLRAEPSARFFALGSALSLCLATATVPADRNLLLAGVGAFGLLAPLIGDLTRRPAGRGARWGRRWLIGTHLVFAPLLLPATSLSPQLIDRFAKGALTEVTSDPAVREQTLVMVNATTLVLTAYYLSIPDEPRAPAPAHIRTLAPTDDPFVLRRDDERTLRLTLTPGYFLEPTSRLARDRDHPLREGEVVRLTGAEFTVLRVDARGLPLELRCRFDVPLEHPSLRWVFWNGRALAPFSLPAVGEERRVEAAPARVER